VKTCTGCGEHKALEQFARSARAEDADPNRRRAECKSCMRRRKLLSRYGLTEAEYDRILQSQGGHCAICRKTTDLVIDHDHATGEVRGVLCRFHNVLIGGFQDDPRMLRRAIRYLERGRK
jgi:hypothetical protein